MHGCTGAGIVQAGRSDRRGGIGGCVYGRGERKRKRESNYGDGKRQLQQGTVEGEAEAHPGNR
jgi:hypothetical protein